MVFHVGICPGWGRLTKYNEKTGKTIMHKMGEVGEKDIKKVDAMFKSIKENINNELGCVCIYLDWLYGNEIRKKFVESGAQHGFKKIHIIDWHSYLYLCCCLESKYKPILGDVIWILKNGHCSIWENEFLTEQDILNIKNTAGTNKMPNLIFNPQKNLKLYINSINGLESSIPLWENFSCFLTDSKPALLKARIIANDPEVMDFKIYTHLDTNIMVEINGDKIMSFQDGLQLPIEEAVIVSLENNENVLEVYFGIIENLEHEIMLITPEMRKVGGIMFAFKIDKNRIFSTHFSIPEPLEKYEHDLKKVYIRKSQKLVFNIPKQIIYNDDSINALGIDLGTSRCCAAVNRRNGIVTVALDNGGERQLPSYVAFDEEIEKCGKIVVNRLQNHAKSTVFDIKRIIGRSFREVKLNDSWPFEVINLKKKAVVKVQSQRGIIEKTSEEISAVLLKHIKQRVEEFQGRELNEVVITVPAAFTETQNIGSHLAAKLVGWQAIHLLPEPVAASIAYFIDRKIQTQSNVMLFDLGGGTLDVCIFKIIGKVLHIMGNTGDTDLGGRDFDQLLITRFENILCERYGINVNCSDKLKYRLMEKCNEIKHTLSVPLSASLDISDFNVDINDHLHITPAEFETLAEGLLIKINGIIGKSLTKTNLNPTDIDKVLIAGGACRMPMIKKLLSITFPHAEHCREENPDEVVAIGAAYYAYYLNQNEKSCFTM